MAIDQDIYLAADNVVVSKDRTILLIRRGNPPYQGMWAFPGGFIETNEEMDVAAARELEEETGLKVNPSRMKLVYTAGKVGRDPRFRTVSVIYYVELEKEMAVMGGDDASEAAWFSLEMLPELAFDHYEILSKIGLLS